MWIWHTRTWWNHGMHSQSSVGLGWIIIFSLVWAGCLAWLVWQSVAQERRRRELVRQLVRQLERQRRMQRRSA